MLVHPAMRFILFILAFFLSFPAFSSERLLDAALRGDLSAVRERIEAGDDINFADYFGETALIAASKKGHVHVVRYLIAQNASLNRSHSVSYYGRRRFSDFTALMEAAWNNHSSSVDSLLNAGAYLNFKFIEDLFKDGQDRMAEHLYDRWTIRKNGQEQRRRLKEAQPNPPSSTKNLFFSDKSPFPSDLLGIILNEFVAHESNVPLEILSHESRKLVNQARLKKISLEITDIRIHRKPNFSLIDYLTFFLEKNETGQFKPNQNLRLLNLITIPFEFRENPVDSTIHWIVSYFPNLQELNTTGFSITDDEVEEIASLKKLRALTIQNGKVGSEGAKFISTLHHLETLKLWSNQVGAEGLRYLSLLPHLQTLHLGDNHISQEGVSFLSRMNNIESLDISRNDDFTMSAEAGEAFSQLTHLHTLSIGQISQEAFTAISSLPNLIILTINQSNIAIPLPPNSLPLYGLSMDTVTIHFDDFIDHLYFNSLRTLHITGGALDSPERRWIQDHFKDQNIFR